MAEPSKLAEFIYNRRGALHLGRAGLADLLTDNGYQTSESAINHWEHGRADPPIHDPVFARALSAALNVSPSDLLKAAEIYENITSEQTDAVLARLSPGVVDLLKEASPQDIKKVEAVIRAMLAENE